jgi:hypothetical protein
LSDLAEHLKRAASAAIEDVMPAVLADSRRVRLVAIELELVNGSTVRAGTCWVERAVNVNKLLGVAGKEPT